MKKTIPISRDASFTKWFENIYSTHFDKLYAYSFVITNDEDLAKDAVSEVFLNLWDSKRDLNDVKNISAYLFTSVKNKCFRLLSDSPSRFNNDEYDLAIASVEKLDPEEILIGRELEEVISETIQKLPTMTGLVFQMIKEKNHSYKEVSTELGITVDTVKYHMKSAMKSLREKLEEDGSKTKVIKWAASSFVIIFLASLLLIF